MSSSTFESRIIIKKAANKTQIFQTGHSERFLIDAPQRRMGVQLPRFQTLATNCHRQLEWRLQRSNSHPFALPIVTRFPNLQGMQHKPGTTEHQLGNATQRHPSADADGSHLRGLERGGRQGLKPMLRPPSTSSGTLTHQPSARQEPRPPEGNFACVETEKSGRAGMTRRTKVVVWALARARTSPHL